MLVGTWAGIELELASVWREWKLREFFKDRHVPAALWHVVFIAVSFLLACAYKVAYAIIGIASFRNDKFIVGVSVALIIAVVLECVAAAYIARSWFTSVNSNSKNDNESAS